MTWKRIRVVLTLLVAAGILYLIYSKISLRVFGQTFVRMERSWFWLALSVFLLSALISSYRYMLVLCQEAEISLGKSLKLYLASNSLNMVFPAKMGEMSKAIFLKKDGIISFSKALPSVIVEKILDLGGLSTIMIVGLVFIPESEMLTKGVKIVLGGLGLLLLCPFLIIIFYDIRKLKLSNLFKRVSFLEKAYSGMEGIILGVRANRTRLNIICFLSVLLWFIQVLQIFFFFRAFSAEAKLSLTAALVPVALFVGLIPVAFAGIGTRDKALIVLFGWYGYPEALMAAVGVMCTLRYIVPALAGLPFMFRYMASSRPQMVKRITPEPEDSV